MNSLLIKLVPLRWLDIGLVLFCVIINLDFVSVHKNAKKEFGQYPAILTSRLVKNITFCKRVYRYMLKFLNVV